MSRIITNLCTILPFKNKFKNILLFLCCSPLLNYILSNIYNKNCTCNITSIIDIVYIFNPFDAPNPFCLLLLSIMGINLYILQYIHYIAIMFIMTLFI